MPPPSSRTSAQPAPRVVRPEPTELARSVGARLRAARDEAGLSQDALASLLGYSNPSMVSAFEAGRRRLKVEDLALICRVLDRSPEYFLPPDRPQDEALPALGVALRAQLDRLPHHALAQTVSDFLDYIEATGPGGSTLPNFEHLKPEAAAAALLKQCSVKEPPVRIEEITRHFALPVVEWAFPDALSALIVQTNAPGYVIGVNKDHPRGRRRFSIAHELGHAVLRHKNSHYWEFTDQSAFGEPPDYDADDEREANAFAAALLMHDRWLRQDVPALHNITKLARRYQVSEEAMSFRLMNLRLV